MTATADSEIPAGRVVKVVAVAGGNLVVALNPVASPTNSEASP
jgi:membrane-bound ClpP family serine protease